MTIKAIETRYKGYRFRSRTEARWGVFFDKIGTSWSYETEGYAFEGTTYLPDFRVTARIGMIVRLSALPERMRAMGDTRPPYSAEQVSRWDDDTSIITTAGGVSTFVEVKAPGTLDHGDIKKCLGFVRASGSALLVAGGDPYDMNLMWAMYGAGFSAGRAAVAGRTSDALHVLVQGVGCSEEDFYLVASEFRPGLMPALIAARSARFEHGECG